MLNLLEKKGNKTEFQLGFRFFFFFVWYVMIKFGFSIWSCYGLRCVVRKPAVAMIAGVDGGGKTTSLGKSRI